MISNQIVFTKKNTAELLQNELHSIKSDEVLVKTEYSTISCGTERANITGDLNISIYESFDKAIFPRYAGYSSSGKVVEVGHNVKSVQVGDSVAMLRSIHSEYNILPEKNVVKFDSSKISMQEAALSYIYTFPMGAVRKTNVAIGESAMVMGLGILGLFAVSILRNAGTVPIIAVDPIAERREKALELGADFAFDPFEAEFIQKVKEATNGGVNVAIEVTGVGSGLNQCLDCMQRFGRISLLGCTRDKDFTVDYYRKVHAPGITIIGAHTDARPDYESHPGWFTSRDDVATYFNLIQNKRLSMIDAIEAVYSPKDCVNVYSALVNDKNFPTVSQFDWKQI